AERMHRPEEAGGSAESVVERLFAARNAAASRESERDHVRGIVILMPALPRQRPDLAHVAGVRLEKRKRAVRMFGQRAVGEGREEKVGHAQPRERSPRLLV